MAEMNRNRDQQNQGSNRQTNQRGDMDRNRNQQEPKPQWDGQERRTGGERRNENPGMIMNEGSSR